MGEMGCIVPGCGDVRKLLQPHPKRGCRRCQSRRVALLQLVYGRGVNRVVCCVEPKQRDMDGPNAVEVDEQMPERTILVIRLEECEVPVDVVEMHESQCCWHVDQTGLTNQFT